MLEHVRDSDYRPRPAEAALDQPAAGLLGPCGQIAARALNTFCNETGIEWTLVVLVFFVIRPLVEGAADLMYLNALFGSILGFFDFSSNFFPKFLGLLNGPKFRSGADGSTPILFTA